jgi:phenylpropionate dioxygenase-like ring-hydroxylating dioxygenase large terminal subunit
MITQQENELLTRVEGDTPMGRLMRENYWLPFAKSEHLVHGDGPTPVRLLGENFVAFRADDGRVGFFDELCPHRRASLTLGRIEGSGVRCIYHGWKLDVSGCVAEAPTQTIRTEQFAASIPVRHFPVHEAGGVAWVWLGGVDAPPFPSLPFAGEDVTHSWMTVSRVPCNWLQGLEGTIDSAHVGFLHQTWHREAAKLAEHPNLSIALDYPPRYETESTPYGMRAAALRRTAEGGTYVRITEHLMPNVTLVSTGRAQPRDGAVFMISPVDDTHHLVFFGVFGQTPLQPPEETIGMVAPGLIPDPHDFAGLRGDRWDRWGQDRELMKAGHFTGFGRNLLEEDAAVQASMGPILDRTKEHLSSGDAAVVHARRRLLEALTAADAGERPPGSAVATSPVRLPNAREAVLDDGDRWQDVVLEELAG